jgi:hypothetical protein
MTQQDLLPRTAEEILDLEAERDECLVTAYTLRETLLQQAEALAELKAQIKVNREEQAKLYSRAATIAKALGNVHDADLRCLDGDGQTPQTIPLEPRPPARPSKPGE